ncbi:MAG: nucleotidyltransferase domain-containing protein [Planctomycetota bacterium]
MHERTSRLAQLCRRYAIEVLYVFGSRAAETKAWFDGKTESLAGGRSDIDISAKKAPGAPFPVEEKVELALALEDLTGAATVDLGDLSQADPFLAADIIRGERLYARDPYQADEYELYVLRRAGDFAPLERERRELALRKRP